MAPTGTSPAPPQRAHAPRPRLKGEWREAKLLTPVMALANIPQVQGARKSRRCPTTFGRALVHDPVVGAGDLPHCQLVAVVAQRRARDRQQRPVVHAPDHEMRHAHPELRRVELDHLGHIHRLARTRHQQRRRPIPVEHAGQRAGRRPGLEIARALLRSQPRLRPETAQHGQQLLEAIGRQPCLGGRGAQIVHVGAGLALRIVLDQRALEGPGMHAVDHHQLGDAVGSGNCRRIADGRTPVVPDQAERPIRRQAIAQRQHVAHQVLDPIGFQTLGLGGAGIAALVGRHRVKRPGEGRQHLVPRARVFGKAVQEQDQRRLRITHGARVRARCRLPHTGRTLSWRIARLPRPGSQAGPGSPGWSQKQAGVEACSRLATRAGLRTAVL